MSRYGLFCSYEWYLFAINLCGKFVGIENLGGYKAN